MPKLKIGYWIAHRRNIPWDTMIVRVTEDGEVLIHGYEISVEADVDNGSLVLDLWFE